MHIYYRFGSSLFALTLSAVGCIGSTSNTTVSSEASVKSEVSASNRIESTSPPVPLSACGLPEVGGGGVVRPSAAPGNLTVLDWAGFDSAVSWTYDDAQPSHIAHYAELQATGIHQTFYISSGVGNDKNFDATWTQAVRDGHELGNHTAHHCHANGQGCTFGKWAGSLGTEFDQCTSFITEHYPQKAVWTSASPFGDVQYDSDSKSRFFLNRGVKSGLIGPNDNTDPSELPCHMAASGESASSFNNAIREARTARKWVILLIHTISPTSANWYNPVKISEITESISATKELRAVWQDSVVNVGAYWMGQKSFTTGSTKTEATGESRTWTLPKNFPSGKCLRVNVDGGVLRQSGKAVAWNDHGYYEVSLDVGSLTLSPR